MRLPAKLMQMKTDWLVKREKELVEAKLRDELRNKESREALRKAVLADLEPLDIKDPIIPEIIDCTLRVEVILRFDGYKDIYAAYRRLTTEHPWKRSTFTDENMNFFLWTTDSVYSDDLGEILAIAEKRDCCV